MNLKVLPLSLLIVTVAATFPDVSYRGGRLVSVGATAGGGGGGGNTLTNNILAYWTMEQGNADQTDSSGNTRTFLKTGTIYSTNGIVSNGVLLTNNVGSFLQVADGDWQSATNQSMTFVLWTKLETIATSGGILAKDSNVSGGREYNIQFTTTGTDGFQISYFNDLASGSAISAKATPTIVVGDWYFVVGKLDPTNNLIGVRAATTTTMGAWVTAATTSPYTNSTTSLRIGRVGTGTPLFGSVDELGMWSRVLTDIEITNLWNNGVGKTWPLN